MLTNETLYTVLAIMTSVAAGLIGSFALLRKMGWASDVMSHIALPGIGLALIASVDPLLGGAVALIVGAIIIWKIEGASGINTDAVVGVVFAISLAIGTLMLTKEELIDALLGSSGELNIYEFLLGAVLAIAVITFAIIKRHALVLVLVSKDLAKTGGINVERLNLYFLIAFAMAIILGLRYLGVLLMGALIMIPPAIGRNLARNLNSMLVVSIGTAAISTSLGLIIAPIIDKPVGPVIIITAGFLFIVSMFFKS